MQSPAMMNERGGSDALVYKQSPNKKEEWQRTKAILEAAPSLMTDRVLLLTLHNNPPLEVVEFMLSLNPQAAAIPKSGPTALQVAVRHFASIEVIICLLKACPFALIASNHDDSAFKDPLTCARELRSKEEDLIHVLTRPLSYWLNESNKERLLRERTARRKANMPLDSAEKDELNNIKAIAATILKAQKRQMEALEIHRHEMKNAEFSKEAILKEFDDQQRKHFKAQLIALDMKEKAMRYKNRNMERRIIRSLEASKRDHSEKEDQQEKVLKKMEEKVKKLSRAVEKLRETTSNHLKQLEMRLEQECKVNDFYRRDTRLQLDQLERNQFQAKHERSDDSAPFIFATHLIDPDQENDAEEPLFAIQSMQQRRRKFWSPRPARRPKI
jgi:hypothetical protein